MSLNAIKHKNILVKILKDIYTDSTISALLGFKGGTAAYLFYNLNRFSVDLDFDLLTEDKEDYVFERIKEILSSYGRLKEASRKNFNLLFLLSYDEKEAGAQNVKLEINRRDFGSKYNIEAYLGISMKVMVKEDMFAHKLCALSERIGKTNRDIFDVYFFFQHDWPLNKKIIETRTGLTYQEFLQKNIKALEEVPERNILSGMGELLDEKQKNWVKTKLKKETLFLLRLALENEKKH
ncbi:MAG: nucleotidyl transferase AbiEii/AbiGii toxin family protein [Patescibacteria group bacterium]|jgi:predicted nucleotidyltransferase component of viral defense system